MTVAVHGTTCYPMSPHGPLLGGSGRALALPLRWGTLYPFPPRERADGSQNSAATSRMPPNPPLGIHSQACDTLRTPSPHPFWVPKLSSPHHLCVFPRPRVPTHMKPLYKPHSCIWHFWVLMMGRTRWGHGWGHTYKSHNEAPVRSGSLRPRWGARGGGLWVPPLHSCSGVGCPWVLLCLVTAPGRLRDARVPPSSLTAPDRCCWMRS